jgi:hypothetical protein
MLTITSGLPSTIQPRWREVLPIHPAAKLLPRMDPDELRRLGEDIKTHGLQSSVIIFIDRDGKTSLLDGISRLDGMELVGLQVIKDDTLNSDIVHFQEIREVDPVAYVLGANLNRRHLSTRGKRELIGNLLVQMPDKSDRQIAALVGVSHHTVASVRSEFEGRGQIAHVEDRTDTKGRKQPATKGPTTGTSEPPGATSTSAAKPYGNAVADPGHATPAGDDADITGTSSPVAPSSARAMAASRAPALAPIGASVAAAFGHLRPVEIPIFLKNIPPSHLRMLKHALGRVQSSDDANAEIAKLARESRALLNHAEHNKDAIYQRLVRIINITDPEQKFRSVKNAAESNAKLDQKLFPRAMGLSIKASEQTEH